MGTDGEERRKPERINLTDTLVRNLEPSPEGNYTRWHKEQRGFGVQVTPRGVKSFVFKCVLHGRQLWVTIGTFPEWNAAKAKERAAEMRRMVDQGIDPRTEIEAEKTAPTVAELADRFLKDVVRIHHTKRTLECTLSLFKHGILPRFGKQRVKDVAFEDVQRAHNDLVDTPVKANRMVGLLSLMMNQAEAWEMRPRNTNPCQGIEKYPEELRERYLSTVEMQALGAELAASESKEPYVVALVRLLILTGARLNEILSLKWSQIDEEHRVIILTEHKTKRQAAKNGRPSTKYLPLNSAALEVLQGVTRLNSNPHVIVGSKLGDHFKGVEGAWRRIRKNVGIRAKNEAEHLGLEDPKINLEDVHLHDLRHTHASMGAGLGYSLPVIGGLLGHSQASTTQRYAHLAASPLLEASEAISAKLAGHLMAGK